MKRIFASVLAVAMMVSLAACGSSKTPSTSGSQSEGSSTSTSQQGGSTAGGALKLVLSTNDGSTTDDRVPTPWYNHNMATNLMFRALTLADSTMDNYAPDLAEVTVSDDGLVYTITMKEGLKWSDGKDLTVDDVVWSIEMVQKAARRNGVYSAAFEKIVDTSVEGNVITLTLGEPYSMMMYAISQFAILPKHCLENESGDSIDTAAYWSDPVTSGYYKVGEFNVGNYFTLVPNEYYEGEPAKIEKVTVSFVTDFLTAAQSNAADYLFGNAADLVQGMAALDNYQSIEVETLFYKYFIFNMKGVDGNQNEAMQPLAVRQALIKAIDRASWPPCIPTVRSSTAACPTKTALTTALSSNSTPRPPRPTSPPPATT